MVIWILAESSAAEAENAENGIIDAASAEIRITDFFIVIHPFRFIKMIVNIVAAVSAHSRQRSYDRSCFGGLSCPFTLYDGL